MSSDELTELLFSDSESDDEFEEHLLSDSDDQSNMLAIEVAVTAQ